MKQRVINNLGLKILSVLIAFFLWLLVVNVSNPEVTRTQEVSLEILNVSVLEDVQKTYEVSRKTVSVAYDIHTLDEYKVKSSDFRAYIDLSELYDVTGSVAVKVEVLNNSNLIRNVAARPGVVRVETEDLQEKEFTLVANIKGRPADGYSLNSTVLTPSVITVKGPVSQVGLINSVGIEVDVSQAEGDRSGTAVPVFYDANGNMMNPGASVELNVEEVAYQISITELREVPVSYEVSGTPADGYVYAGYEAVTRVVPLSGAEDVIASVSVLTITDSVLNVDGLSEDQTVTVDLREHLPDGLSLAEHVNPLVSVTLKVEELTTRTLTLSGSQIRVTGAASGYEYRIQPTRIGVTLRGREEDLDGLTSADLSVSVDVSGMVQGLNDCGLQFEEDDRYTVAEVESVQVEVLPQAEGPGVHVYESPAASMENHEEAESSSQEEPVIAAGAGAESAPSENQEETQQEETAGETDAGAAE